MTTAIDSNSLDSNWRNLLADTIKDPVELFNLLKLPQEWLPKAIAASHLFPFKVTRSYVNRIKPGDPNDPLLLQILPLGSELLSTPGFIKDPVGDLTASVLPGLLHKYTGRVLLTITGACAIHCRYCFRRHFPYNKNNPMNENWSHALNYIAADTSISEVILSGGDPLVLSDARLASLINDIAAISHVKRLRIHSRIPVIIPQRITTMMLEWLNASRLKTVLVIHTNHANEIDDQVANALIRVNAAGVCVLNQTVLLKHINDKANVLIDLSNRLFAAGVLPYYLHILDPVEGAAHFDVPRETALNIINQLQNNLPMYLVPRLAVDQAGKGSKTLLM